MTLTANWSKAGGETRTEEYRTWRTTRGFGAVSDIDQIEYLWQDGRPILAIELCVADRQSPDHPSGIPEGFNNPSPGFFEQVERKVCEERPQGKFVRRLVSEFQIPFILVVYISGELDRGLWVKRVDTDSAWRPMSLAEYESRLRSMYTLQRV